MKRSKRHILRQIALGLAIAAIIPATAQAQNYSRAPIPYLSQGVGVDVSLYSGQMSPDDRAFSKASTELGYSAVKSPDDRMFSKATSVGTAPVATSSGDRIDFNSYTVTGSLIALLLAMGAVIAIRHGRKGRLSPA